MSGFVGETLLDAAVRHRYDYVLGACRGGGNPVEKLHKEGGWVEPKFGEGVSCYYCHVVVGKEHAHELPRMGWDEKAELDKYPLREDITETCVCGEQLGDDTGAASFGISRRWLLAARRRFIWVF